MRKTALAGLFACTIITVSSSTVSAEKLEILEINNNAITVSEPIALARLTSLNSSDLSPISDVPKPVEPPVVKYAVAENDSLSSIAERHSTTWVRLFNKNTSIANPDVLVIGSEVVIPTPAETLAERPLPEPPAVPVPAPTALKSATLSAKKPAVVAPRARTAPQSMGYSAGNTYAPGYCTWYVKNKRPGLPNNLGNADTWVSRAAAQGMPTSSTPTVGAVGQRGMHVVYVESINGDGSVNISEMNHAGLYVITHRTLPASYFKYIN